MSQLNIYIYIKSAYLSHPHTCGGFCFKGEKTMTKKEKQLLRVALAIIQDVLSKDNKRSSVYLNEKIRKHPEKFDKEFITETGFDKEEVQRLLKVRSERLKGARRSSHLQD